MKYLVIATLLASCMTAFGGTPLDDLNAALGTGEKIWEVQRDFQRDSKATVDCVYDKKLSHQGNNYEFEHGYRSGGQQKKITLYGTAGEESGKATLTITATQGQEGNKHILEHWSNEDKCFILSFTNSTAGNTKQCALHVWQEKLTSYTGGNYPCSSQLETICPGTTKHNLFTSSCLTSA